MTLARALGRVRRLTRRGLSALEALEVASRLCVQRVDWIALRAAHFAYLGPREHRARAVIIRSTSEAWIQRGPRRVWSRDQFTRPCP